MRPLSSCFAMLAVCSAIGAEPPEHVKKQFESETYTVTWEAVAIIEPGAELEIGVGSGHGDTLNWMRFQPSKDGVDVLSISFDGGRESYKSKWPPDRAQVTVKSARMKRDAYAAILADLALVKAATLKPVKPKTYSRSSNDFWVSTRLTLNKKTLVDLDWAGYETTREEINFAKPLGAATLASEAIEKLGFKDHALTADERRWASAKFTRDWKTYKDSEPHRWVRDRAIITIGVVGDATAYPTLREILGGEPKDHSVYHAVNAVTRLAKTDIRDKPVEEMDTEKARKKVLDLIKDKK